MKALLLLLILNVTVHAECTLPATDKCAYIQRNCSDIGLMVDYLQLLYCHNWYYVVFALMVALIVVIFYLLSISSSDHFVPILTILSKHLSMSADLAGITVLAVGNGAPDVFSTFVAIYNTGDFQLAASEVIGSGCFVSSIVIASIVIMNANVVMPQTLIHNISFYLVALLFVFFIYTSGTVTLFHSIGFIIIYIAYVLFIAFITRGRPLIRVSDQLEAESTTRLLDEEDAADAPEKKEETESLTPPDEVKRLGLKDRIAAANYFNKALLVLSIPFRFVMEYTTPHITDERTTLLVSFALSPLPICIAGGIPLKFVCIPFIISVGLVVVVHLTKIDIPTIITNIYGFIISVLYIYIFASELVAILQSLGIAMHIDSSLLGLTVLCWGNSIGDLVSNMIVSSQGYSEMGIIASYGGPCFNMLVGLGLGTLARSIRHLGEKQTVTMTDTMFFSTIFLICQLAVTLVIVTVNGKLTRAYAFVLIAAYLVVIGLSLPSAFNVFKLFG